MSDSTRFVGEVSVGEKRILSPPEVMRFHIHDFAACRGPWIKTPSVQAHGYRWSLYIGLGEDEETRKTLGGYLYLDDSLKTEGDHVKTIFSLNLGETKYRYVDVVFTGDSEWDGGFLLMKRDKLLKKHLTSCGTLTIDVEIQVYKTVPDVWYPSPPNTSPMMEKLFTSPLHADISYLVGGREYKAHKCIVAMSSPTLGCAEPENGSKGVEIMDVDSDTFEILLRFLYTGRVPTFDENDAKQVESLFMAADRFGCKDLKLLMESTIVDKVLNSSNAASWLLHGDSHSCALLKEAAVEQYLQYPDEFVQSDGWSMVTESKSLLLELMTAARSSRTSNDDIEHMRVSTLRDRLAELGEDVDGSREMLIHRLQSSVSSCEGADAEAASVEEEEEASEGDVVFDDFVGDY